MNSELAQIVCSRKLLLKLLPKQFNCGWAAIWPGPLWVRGPLADPKVNLADPKVKMKLTERKIEKLMTEYGRKDRLVFDDGQRGLAVRVTGSGGRTYLCQYTPHGHKWRVPLGACSAVEVLARIADPFGASRPDRALVDWFTMLSDLDADTASHPS